MPIKFGEFTGAKCLRKRREPFKEVTQLTIHGEPISDMDEVRKKYGGQNFRASLDEGPVGRSQPTGGNCGQGGKRPAARHEKFNETTCMSL